MTKPPLRFASFLAPTMFPVYQAIADTIARTLNYPTTLISGTSFDQFAKREIDVGFICGLPYVWLADQTPPAVELLAAPVLSGERYAGRPVYFSDVIVQRDSPYHNFSDLRGCSWSYNGPDSHSGYNAVRWWLAEQGEPHGYFGRVVRSGSHQRSVQWVCSGQIDASAIDSQVLAIEMRDHPEIADQVRVIDQIGPSSIQPVVAAAHVSDSLKSELREALLSMDTDPLVTAAFAHGFVERFTAVTDADYNDIRRMAALAAPVKFA